MRYETVAGGYKIVLTTDDKISKPKSEDTRSGASGIIVIDKIPSTNKLFGTYRKRKFLYPELRDWRDYIVSTELPKTATGSLPDTEYLEIKLGFCITSSYGSRDVDNMCKFMIDTICEFYKTDDYRFAKLQAYKIQAYNSTTKWDIKHGDEYVFYQILPYTVIQKDLGHSDDLVKVD